MTNSARISDIAFPDVAKGSKIRRRATLTNQSGQVVNVTGISSSMGYFSSVFARKVQPNYPASSTIYFQENFTLQNANGEFATTDHGFGVAGTTDADGKFTFKPVMLSLSLTGPVAGTKYKLSESFNVTWTSSNITLVNVILESESGGSKTYSDVDASLGTLAVAISASDGFKINETVYIYIENTHQSIDDSVQVQSIATLTINTPTLTAGTEGNVTGTSNGVEVDVYYRVSNPEGAWEVFEEGVAVSGGNWSATGTIPAADTYDFKVEDTTDRDGSAQVDDVVVASGVVLTALQITNASDAGTKGNITATESKFYGDNILFAGFTNSSKINVAGTDYLTGVDADFTYVTFIVSMSKNHKINWVKFFKRFGREAGYWDKSFDTDSNYIYTLESFKSGTYFRTYIRRLNPSDGTTQASLALTPINNVAVGQSISIYSGTIHCFGHNTQGGIQNGYFYRWSTGDFATISTQRYGDESSMNFPRSAIIDSYGRNLVTYTSSSNNIATHNLSGGDIYKLTSFDTVNGFRTASSADRILFCERSGGNCAFNMREAGVAISHGNYFLSLFREQYNANNTSIYLGDCDFDGTDFNAFYNDGSKFIIRKIADADTYTKIGDDIEITPNSITNGIRSAHITQDSTHYIITGGISGKMESSFIPDDSTKYDGFVKLVAK